MDLDLFTCKDRKKRFDAFRKIVELEPEPDTGGLRSHFKIGRVLGRGLQGTVYKATHKKGSRCGIGAIVIKRTNVTEAESRRRNYTSRSALRNPVFIEFAAAEMCQKLILNKVCPNVTLNYHYEIRKDCNKYSSVSRDPYCSLQYNEFINYGTFQDFAEKRHREEIWYNAVFQILAGLYALKHRFNMIHNDFHGRNLLVQKITPGGYWVYIIDGKRYYVPNLGYIFFVSDFGFAWIPGKMYPGKYVRKKDEMYLLMDSNDTRLNRNTRLTWDLMKLKRLTIDPLLKVSKKIPKHFKEDFITLFEDLIDNSVNVSTLGDIIRELYGSKVVRGKKCDMFPNYCYDKRKFVENTFRIETYNFDAKFRV